jgi:hypothetical protein
MQAVPTIQPSSPASAVPFLPTRRDYFAAMAMQGMLAGDRNDWGDVISDAVDFADELIAALDKEAGPNA